MDPVELQEIEHHRAAIPGSSAVLIALRRDGGKRLVASVGRRGSVTSIWRRVARRRRQELLDYMVPSSIVLLEELPLSANGKVDSAACRNPGLARCR